jgi:hypothetical protein
MLNDRDSKILEEKGIAPQQIEQQIQQFKNGFSPLKIVKPALVKDGVRQLTDKKLVDYVALYEKNSKRLKKLKFVPASGAATRMFKKQFEILNTYKGTEEDYLKLMSEKDFNSINYMCQNLKKFAFFNDLVQSIESNGSNFEEISKNKDIVKLIENLLTESGLNYGNLPKGLLKFHRTESAERTPVEEHLIEGAMYAGTGRKVHMHFTVSADHLDLFKKHLDKVVPAYQKQFKVKYNISFSIQKPKTDTIAVDMENEPVRDEQGNLVFRPGGHGALIYNLNEVDADLIFIKNIDNVVQDRLKEETYVYKKALAGILLETYLLAEEYYKKLSKRVKPELLAKTEEFIEKRLGFKLPESYNQESDTNKKAYLSGVLNRPYRVCGMVRNEGEPGGGPFWVQHDDGSKSLQIIEGSQFLPEQKEIMNKATYFNPVDLVCYTKNFKGKPFDLTQFVDQQTGFISTKSVQGKEIKALELPGLWNGAMAFWNTIFVEVPIGTFNPVKTLSDLLRAEHLYEKDLLSQELSATDIFK